jgi:hypothetical protein
MKVGILIIIALLGFGCASTKNIEDIKSVPMSIKEICDNKVHLVLLTQKNKTYEIYKTIDYMTWTKIAQVKGNGEKILIKDDVNGSGAIYLAGEKF